MMQGKSDTRMDQALSTPVELSMQAGQTLIAEIIVEKHPVLEARSLVSGNDQHGIAFECWVNHLHGLVLRSGDTVLLQRPGNSDEPLITGIVESTQPAHRQIHRLGGELSLNADEALRITDHNGKPLLDIAPSADGTVLQLHVPVAETDMPGNFKLVADSISLEARQGEMSLTASGDINVDGEIINLN